VLHRRSSLPRESAWLKLWHRPVWVGRLSVFNGDVYVVTLDGIKTTTTLPRPAKPSHEPDFTRPDAVIADLERMKSEGRAKKARLVVVKCNYAINTINNFIRSNPQGDPGILKQRWMEAYPEYKKMK